MRLRGLVDSTAMFDQNWNDFSSFKKQPNGKWKLTIPYIITPRWPTPKWMDTYGTNTQLHFRSQWATARENIEKAKAFFEDTNVKFVEYRVFPDIFLFVNIRIHAY